MATDAEGSIIGDVYDYETADLWNDTHQLNQAQAAAEYVAPEVERLAYQGGEAWDASPSPLTVDPWFGSDYHDFSAGSYDIDVGAYDMNPSTWFTDLDLEASASGYDVSDLDYWEDNSFSGDWTYEADGYFDTFDYGGWDYGDFFFPVVLDLNGDGVDITPRTDSTAYFDVDNDGYYEQVAWAGPQDGLLVIDLDINGNFGPDGIIDLLDEIAFYSDDPNVETDLEALKAEFDSNSNSLLDPGDTYWSHFRVWKDVNQDGVSDAGEVFTLNHASIAITSISLVSDNKAFLLPDNTLINGFGSFTRTVNGVATTAALADAAFAYDELGFWSENVPGVGFTYHGEDGSVMPYQDAIDLGRDGIPWNYVVNDTWAGVLGGVLNDTFSTTGLLGQTFYGDFGNDTLTGGPGEDMLDGGPGTDAIQGNGGDDTIYFEAPEVALVNGGAGYDTGILASAGAIIINLADRGLESFISAGGGDAITANPAIGNYIDGRAATTRSMAAASTISSSAAPAPIRSTAMAASTC